MLFDLSGLDIAGLTLASAFGFLVGKLRKIYQRPGAAADQDLRKAKVIVQEFEGIAEQLQKAMDSHQSSVLEFKERVNQAAAGKRDADWEDLTVETEKILQPTLALADEVARAYDQIRRQSSLLMNLQESRIDSLTGVGNRRMFDDSLEVQLGIYRRYGTPFGVILIDIDHFKQVNDTKGHLIGDQILAGVGKLLKGLARDTDIVTRYGGEEFVILLPETSEAGTTQLAERIRRAVEEQLNVTVSGGIATTDHFDDSRELMHAADQALYQAKEAGRNRMFVNSTDGTQPLSPAMLEMDDAVAGSIAL